VALGAGCYRWLARADREESVAAYRATVAVQKD